MILHLAAAGGGSSGFHGGGGGRGGGAALYFLFQILIRVAIFGHGLGVLILIGIALVLFLITRGATMAQRFQAQSADRGRGQRTRTAKRERRVELAAAEAAEDDPEFAPDRVRAAAANLFAEIQRAWDADDRGRLGRLVAPELMTEWRRRLADFSSRGWRNRVQLIGEPDVVYVGLSHRNAASDHVVVRIEAKLRDYVEDLHGTRLKRTDHAGEVVRVREYWTLGRHGGRWVLRSIEQGAEGEHALDEQVIATPWGDDQALRDEAMIEGAVADAAPAHVSIAELADLDFDGDARAAALDLSLADARFAPDVLEIAARRAIDAWAEAVDGDDSALEALADPRAMHDLLHPGDPTERTRLVVRGPKLKQVHVVALDAGATPPTMTIDVQLTGRRYIEDRDTTAVIAGSKTQETKFTERWILALDGNSQQPWRLAAAPSPR